MKQQEKESLRSIKKSASKITRRIQKLQEWDGELTTTDLDFIQMQIEDIQDAIKYFHIEGN